MKVKLVTACVVSLVTLSGMASHAQTVAPGSRPRVDVAAAQGSQLSLSNVIDQVERTTGAKVIRAAYSERGGESGFDVLAVQDGRAQYLRLTGAGGAFSTLNTLDAQSRPRWMSEDNARDAIEVASGAKIPLGQAVLNAEQDQDLPAVAAGVARVPASPSSVRAYSVVLSYPNGNTRHVAVNVQTGRVIGNPDVLKG
jgi:hypothetical protein